MPFKKGIRGSPTGRPKGSVSTTTKAFELLSKCYFKIKPQYNHYDDVWLLDEVPQKKLDYSKLLYL